MKLKSFRFVLASLLIILSLLIYKPALVLAQDDTTPPVLHSLEITPSTVDTTNSSVTLTATVNVTDDLVGVSPDNADIEFASPDGFQHILFDHLTPIDEQPDTYTITTTMDQTHMAGVWTITYLSMRDINGTILQLDAAGVAAAVGHEVTITNNSTATIDRTPPTLHSLEIIPSTVDTTDGSVSLTATVNVTDDLNGIGYAYIEFVSPDNTKYLGFSSLIPFDGQPDTYTATTTMDQTSESGIWRLSYLDIRDSAGNILQLDATGVATAVGHEVTITNNSTAVRDTTPPVLHSLSIEPSTVDTSNGPVTLTVTLNVTDDISGVSLEHANIQLTSPDGILPVLTFGDFVQIEEQPDVYTTTAVLPQYSKFGTWKIDAVNMLDNAGNWLNADVTTIFQVVGHDVTVINTPVDSDNDGVTGEADKCPTEDATGFDANVDGCIDNIQGLQQVVNTALLEGVVTPEIVNSLTSKVTAALNSIDREKDNAAVNQLQAFINELNAQRGNKISDEAADLLIWYAQNVITNIQGQ